jgi:hypothetical protein
MAHGAKICIAIAVHQPERLTPLPGALTAARSIVEWADALGYRTKLITDEAEPVTCARLKSGIQPLIAHASEDRDRVIISFAGHGVAADVRDLWLLSRWRSGAEEAVDVLRFRSRLATYLPAQVTIISDACRTARPNDSLDLQGSRILDLVEWGEPDTEEDILRATTLGKPAYMVRSREDGEPHCLFTHVVTNALWGRYPESIDKSRPEGPVVTSQTLKKAVKVQLNRAANLLDKSQRPEIVTNFTPPEDVYTPLTGLSAPPTVTLVPAQPKPVTRRAPLRPTEGVIDFLTHDLHRIARAPAQRARRSSTPRERAAALTQRLRQEAAQRPTHFETGTGLAILGDQISEVVVGPTANALLDMQPEAPLQSQGLWYVLQGPPGSLVARLASGRWVAAALYPDMIGTISVDAYGAAAVVYRPAGNSDPRVAAAAEQAVGALQSGSLGDGEALGIAARIREFKHVDPTLGAIAAYLYARAGDLDGIRRIAAYYCWANQPIPYDVALLGRLPLRREGPSLWATVPPTAERASRAPEEDKRAFTTRATPEVEGPVAGSFPWLRQGWSLIEDYRPPVYSPLAALERGLTRALFTTLEDEQGHALANLIRTGEV